MSTQVSEIKDIEREYYHACDRAVALRQELAAAIAEIDALRRKIHAHLALDPREDAGG